MGLSHKADEVAISKKQCHRQQLQEHDDVGSPVDHGDKGTSWPMNCVAAADDATVLPQNGGHCAVVTSQTLTDHNRCSIGVTAPATLSETEDGLVEVL